MKQTKRDIVPHFRGFINKRIIQSAIILIVALIMLLSSIPLIETKGRETEKRLLYKNQDIQIKKEYEWSEILIEDSRYQIQESIQGVGAYKGFKSFESTDKVTYGNAGWINSKSVTNESGFQMINDRYLVAMGTRFGLTIGQYFDIVLENGTIIPCILGDEKDDNDTDITNTFTTHSRCATEFIVSTDKLPKNVLLAGDVSIFCDEWDSPVVEIIKYKNTYTEAE